MSLLRLRTFIEVYRQRSISGAARVLNLTQPAVSQHIIGLEVAIGRPLFERQPQGVKPTVVADDLAADIGNKLDDAESALASARARSMDVAGTLQIIGHSDFMAEKLAGELLPLLESGIRVHLHAGDGPMVSQMVIEGHCDLDITAHPVTDARLKGDVIFSDRVIAIASPTLAERLNNSEHFGRDLLNEPLLAYNLELSLIEHWLGKNRIKFSSLLPAMVGQDLRGQRSLLCKGFGWTVMPEFLCREHLDEGKLAVLKHQWQTRKFVTIWCDCRVRYVSRVWHTPDRFCCTDWATRLKRRAGEVKALRTLLKGGEREKLRIALGLCAVQHYSLPH